MTEIVNRDHEAEIINIDDPNKEGRIKVNIKGVFGNIDGTFSLDPEKLPWIYPEFPHHDTFHTPKLGEKVLVWFSKDINHGRYRSWESVSDDLKELLKEDYEGYKSVLYDKEEEVNISYSRKKGIVINLGKETINISKEEQKITLNFNEGQRKVVMNENSVSVVSDKISLGSLDGSSEPSVLGDKNEEQLKELWKAIEKINKDIETSSKIQKEITSKVAILAPLSPGFALSELSAKANPISNKVFSSKVPKTKSKVNTID